MHVKVFQTKKTTELSGHGINSLSEPTLYSYSNFFAQCSRFTLVFAFVRFATPCFTVPDLLFRIPYSGVLCVVPLFTVPDLLFSICQFRICCSVFANSGFVVPYSCSAFRHSVFYRNPCLWPRLAVTLDFFSGKKS